MQRLIPYLGYRAWEDAGQFSPLDLEGVHAVVYCVVDDVDAHYRRAKAGGATIAVEPPEEHGSRMYRALDPEGHRWIFASSGGDGGSE